MTEKTPYFHIPPEIVWHIMLFSKRIYLPSMFRVCKNWSKISHNRNFWFSYYENEMEFPEPNFLSSTFEGKVVKFIGDNNLHELKKQEIKGKLKNLPLISFSPSWSRLSKKREKVVSLNFLAYAIAKKRTNIVKYFVENDIFSLSDGIIETNSVDPREKSKIVDVFTICYYYHRIEILEYIVGKCRPSFVSPFICPSFVDEQMGRLFGLLIGMNSHFTSIPSFIFPILRNDLESVEYILSIMPAKTIWGISPSVIQHCLAKKKYGMVRLFLRNGGYDFLAEIEFHMSVGKSDNIPNKLMEEIWEANTKFCKEIEGMFVVYVKTLSGVKHKLVMDSPDSKMCELKSKLEEKAGIPPLSQRLVFMGRIVGEGSLRDFGIGFMYNLQLIVQLK